MGYSIYSKTSNHMCQNKRKKQFHFSNSVIRWNFAMIGRNWNLAIILIGSEEKVISSAVYAIYNKMFRMLIEVKSSVWINLCRGMKNKVAL